VITSRLFPRRWQADRPQCQAETLELTDADIRKALQIPPAEHAAANDAQVEQLLLTATPGELRQMIRELRTLLRGAEFAARTNAETVAALWSKRR
jgi:hypothetical protein